MSIDQSEILHHCRRRRVLLGIQSRFGMKIAAAQAIADLIPEQELRPEYIVPHALDARVPPVVTATVAWARPADQSGSRPCRSPGGARQYQGVSLWRPA